MCKIDQTVIDIFHANHTLTKENVMARVYNFSAGPSMLPEPVLKKAAAELLEYPGSGQSVMEMSHRSTRIPGHHRWG
jgi:hypothetical protein